MTDRPCRECRHFTIDPLDRFMGVYGYASCDVDYGGNRHGVRCTTARSFEAMCGPAGTRFEPVEPSVLCWLRSLFGR